MKNYKILCIIHSVEGILRKICLLKILSLSLKGVFVLKEIGIPEIDFPNIGIILNL